MKQNAFGRSALPPLCCAALLTVPVAGHAQIASLTVTAPLAVGAAAPAYSLPDQNGQIHTLSADKGKVVLLAFYPADFTGGCTQEAHSLTAADPDLKALGVQVYGVSVQDSKSHQAFCTKEGIPYTLLADIRKDVSRQYGVLMPTGGFAQRVTFLVGKDGKIDYVDTGVNSHLGTCGADWVTWLKAHPQITRSGPAAQTVASSHPVPRLQLASLTSMASGQGATLGKSAPDFTLPNALTGAPTTLSSLMAGKKAAVVMFISTRCPISNAYNERMSALASQYGAEGVAFVAVNANHNEPMSEVKTHAAEHKYPFPVLKDINDKVADAYDARVTPETYVITSAGTLVYHGRIDNSDDPSQVKTHDLASALDSVVAGRPVAKARTKAFGCSIPRPG